MKQILKKAVKQLAQEPLEILKTARQQVEAPEQSQQQESQQPQEQGQPIGPTIEEKKKKEVQSQRLMQAYEAELAEIRNKRQQEDLQKKKTEIAQQEQKQEEAGTENIIQVVSKKGRRMFGKVGLKREQTKVEMRQPPSS